MSLQKHRNNSILLAGLFICGPVMNGVHAQTLGQVNVSVVLNDFIEVSVVKTTASMVLLHIAGADNYVNGISQVIPNHLVISSSREFNLMARAAYPSFTSGTYSSFPANVLSIYIDNKDISGTGLLIRPVEGLEIMDQPLITKAPAVIRKYLNVRYKISSGKLKEEILGKHPGSYNNTVIFTLSTF